MIKPAALAATMLIHRSYSRGQDNLIDADVTQLAEAYPDLRPVFEELQFLRRENDRLEFSLAHLD